MSQFNIPINPLTGQPKWIENVDGTINLSVTTDGTTGMDWIVRLNSRHLRIGKYARQVLLSPDFKSTRGVTTEVTLLKALNINSGLLTIDSISIEADNRGLLRPSADVACLIREMLTDVDITIMGLSHLITMHEPINDSYGDPSLLGAHTHSSGHWLFAQDVSNHRLSPNYGFAFARQVRY